MVGEAQAASWQRKIEILKAATDQDVNLREIASRFNVSKATVWNTLNDFTSAYQLTEDESDFPRKLLKLYNVNIPTEGGGDRLDVNDVRNLKHYVERARKREMGEDEADSIPTDYSNDPTATTRGVQQMSYGQDPNQGKNFDKTTEDGLWRSILYSAKNVNPQANERFINLYNLGKKGFLANPQSLLDIMRHMFGPGFGTDAFNLYHNSKGEYIAETAGQPSAAGMGGMGGMDPLMMMMLMGGGNGGGMAQILPMLMQQSQQPGGGGQMPPMMQMMLMSEIQKQNEKKEKQEQWDQMMNMMMIKMLGGTMDSRQQMDAASGNFMVNEILDKDRNVTKRELVPMATILSNPLMAGGIFGKGSTDDTTAAVLKNALDEKSKMMELYMQQNQPMAQIMMSLLSNYQQKNDPVQMISTLMDIQDKFIKPGGAQIDPEIEKMKIDLQLATNQQNMTLEQMKHTWEMEREEKKAGAENVKSWMNMIGTVGEKLAAPAMSIIAGGMGKGGMLNQGQPGPGGGLPPLGASPVKPGGLDVGAQQQQRGVSAPSRAPIRTEGVSLGIPDPDHNSHLVPDINPQQQQRQDLDPQMMLLISKMQQLEQSDSIKTQEINRLRGIIVSGANEQQQQRRPQQGPALTKDQLAQLSTEQVQEMLESLKDNEQDVERKRQRLEAELSDREWLSQPPPEVDKFDEEEANKIAQQNEEDEPEQMSESLEEPRVDDVPIDEPAPTDEEEPTS